MDYAGGQEQTREFASRRRIAKTIMKNLEKLLMLACLVVSAEGIAQSNDAQSMAPSSVDKIAPATRPFAGTLFFGREQRDQMDRVRKLGAVAAINDEGVPVEPKVSVLNGFVKRSDGQTAIWVDGRPRYNVHGDDARRLQPQDVGGESEHVKVLLKDADTPVVGSSRVKSRVRRR